jgi:hypothetical protein
MSPKTITSKRHSKSHRKTNNNNQVFRKKITEKNLEACKWATGVKSITSSRSAAGITNSSPSVCIKKMNDCYLNKCYNESKNKENAMLINFIDFLLFGKVLQLGSFTQIANLNFFIKYVLLPLLQRLPQYPLL